MRRILSVLFWTLALAGCGGQKPVIGMVPKSSSHRFWQAVHAGAVKAAQEFNVDIDWQSPPDLDARSQAAVIERMIAKRVAGIGVAPTDVRALSTTIGSASGAGIPVALFATSEGSGTAITRVTSDEREGGRMAARRLAELMMGSGECAIFGVRSDDESTTAREEGFRQVMKEEYPKIRILETVYNTGSPAQAEISMNRLLDRHGDVTGVFADNEWSSAGVVTALRLRSESQVRVVAFDANRQLVSDLQDRFVDAVIVRDPVNIGYETVKAIVGKLRGEAPPPRIDAGVYLVDRSNLEEPGIISVLYPDVQRFLNPPRR